jgi:4-amino-4-deoxy-L-arabinose transferase-like glycosyltransferase
MRRSGADIIATNSSWLERVTGVADAHSARHATRTWRRGGLALIILCLLVYIPGLWTIPPVDRDESRFAQASRQMLESGTLEGWVVPRIQDKPRLNKPPLIYWLQASSAAILGDRPQQWAWLDAGSENIWVYRVPSMLSAIAAVLLTWRLGVRMFDPRAAWLGAAFLAVCPMVVWDAHQARADQLLLATTTATMLALYRVWLPPPSPSGRGNVRAKRERGEGAPRTTYWAIAFWLSLSLGIMTKGPITPMIAALACIALSLVSRNWRWLLRLRPLLGLVIVAAVVSPWLILVGNAVGWSNYLHIIYDETIGRSAGAKEGHWGPPGYHIVLLGVLFWPGSLLTAAAIGRAWKRGLRATPSAATGRLRRLAHHLRSLRPSRPAELFLLAWMLPAWLVFELVSTKLPHYTMPLYPAVALMSARAVFGARAMFLPALNAARATLLTSLLATTNAKCATCKYQLRGLTVPACPECSAPLSISDSGRLAGGYMADRSQRPGRILWLFFGVALCIGLPSALILDNITPADDSVVIVWNTFMMACGLAVWFGAIAGLRFATKRIWRDDLVGGAVLAMVPSIVAFAISFSLILPRTDSLWISRRVALMLHEHRWTPDTPLYCTEYAEDSLIFLTRGVAKRLVEPGAFTASAQNHHRFVAIIGQNELRHGVALEYPTPPVNLWGVVDGFNYSTGHSVRVRIIEFNP